MKDVFRKLKIRIVIRRYEVIICGSVMLLSGAVIPSSWDPPMRFYPAPQVELAPKHPWIALTFDDGPHPVMTDRLLSILREQHVPGTFFVVGKMADRYPQLVKDIARDGNEVANHTYSHPNLSRLSNDAVLSELAHTRELIQRLTGRDSCLFRPPGGDYSRQMVRATARAGYRMVLWSVLTDDVDGASSRFIRRRILDGAEDGAIILMHSGVERTVQVLPEVIAKLRARGYHFVTVSTLMGLQPPSLVPSPDTSVLHTAAATSRNDVRTQ